jgi:hypothetical protein
MQRLWIILFSLSLYPLLARSDSGIDSLTGTWGSLDSYVTLGNCISAPAESGRICSPAQLGEGRKDRLEFSGFLSGTNSALDLSDAVKKERLNSATVEEFFSKYNYSEFLLFGNLQYVSTSSAFLVGVTPVKYQGQLELHNPNLPLVSFVVREDLQFFLGKAFSASSENWKFSAGGKATLLSRTERVVETTIVDIAARPTSDIVSKRKLTGSFFDIGMSMEYRSVLKFSLTSEDLGGYWKGQRDNSNQYLFINFDRTPRSIASFAYNPKIWYGILHLGIGAVHLYNRNNFYSNQWMATASYYLGPVRILSGFGKNVFRTGLGIDFSGHDVAVAQEWVNKLEDGRYPQPRFTLSVAASL